jgi:hypothetical protein
MRLCAATRRFPVVQKAGAGSETRRFERRGTKEGRGKGREGGRRVASASSKQSIADIMARCRCYYLPNHVIRSLLTTLH